MIDQANSEGAMSLGPFRLVPSERLLEKAGVAVQLGSRALDILIVLVEHAGEVVSKRELIARVWPDVTVDEGSLRFHIAALRRALGDGEAGAKYISNVPGRGYCFAAAVSRSKSFEAAPAAGPVPNLTSRLPAPLARMVGRDDTVRTISARLIADRFVTIVGPGGIGKTTVAVSVAHALAAEFGGSTRFIDLGMLTDPSFVPNALTSAFDISVQSDPVSSLIDFLKNKRMLLVLDSCEHVIEMVSILAERIFAEALETFLVATSREPLNVEGEHVHRLFPLDYPPDNKDLTASEALEFPAVELFVERANAASIGFVLSDSDAPVVAEICRKLDGIALAVEIAASRVNAFGIREIAAVLNSRIGLLWSGRRTAPPRQQTLNATLDWSYDLLSEFEREALCRLSVLVGPFTLRAAQTVAAEDDAQAANVAEAIAGLVGKSLVSTDWREREARYRFLDTTRAYAMQKLLASGEMRDTSRRHAIHCQMLLESNNAGPKELIRPEDAVAYMDQIGNIRSALEWSFSAEGNAEIGIGLVAAAAPILLSMSLWQECQRWTEKAIDNLDQVSRSTRRELALQSALGMSLLARQDPSDAARVAFARGLAIAEDLKDTAQQLRLISELRVIALFSSDNLAALQLAQKGKAIADSLNDPAEAALADAELGVTCHIVGDQAAAQRHCEAVLARVRMLARGGAGHFKNDRLIQTRCALASTLWLRGLTDQATALAKQIIDELKATEDFLLFSNSLLWIIPVFLWSGDWSTGERLIGRLIKNAQEHALGIVEHVGIGLEGQLLVGEGDAKAGIALLQKSQDVLRLKGFQLANIISLALGLADIGDFGRALQTIDRAIPEENQSRESQLLAEILRVKGDILASTPGADLKKAEQWLLEAREIARRQSALSWELRAATSLASLWRKWGRTQEARDMLTSVYERFTEGFDTLDLKTARRLLDELA
jgi:predicted ATPase/DNA-binding winged helix-turn-helix (wHTH) protein